MRLKLVDVLATQLTLKHMIGMISLQRLKSNVSPPTLIAFETLQRYHADDMFNQYIIVNIRDGLRFRTTQDLPNRKA